MSRKVSSRTTSSQHRSLCSFSPQAQPRRNLVDFECTHNITINEFIHCNILTMTQNMNHTSQLMKQWLMLSIESRSSRKVYPPCSGFTLPHGGINVYKCTIKNGPPCNHNGLPWIHRWILLFTTADFLFPSTDFALLIGGTGLLLAKVSSTDCWCSNIHLVMWRRDRRCNFQNGLLFVTCICSHWTSGQFAECLS